MVEGEVIILGVEVVTKVVAEVNIAITSVRFKPAIKLIYI